ncbi:hypothetical protein [Gordonia sp. SCSIO 19800]|uniref:hypothetical protein n=1 Tax=Gordonia sp. SCSIO 19800 TaxID=2826926 RepID=UPI0035ABF537
MDTIQPRFARCEAWQRLSTEAAAEGDASTLEHGSITGIPTHGGQYSVLIRRNDTTGDLAFYRCCSPRPATLGELVRVAGRRWTVEESFQTGKGLTGLDQH